MEKGRYLSDSNSLGDEYQLRFEPLGRLTSSARSGRPNKWKPHGTTRYIEDTTPRRVIFVKHDKLGPSRFPLFSACFSDMYHNFYVPEKYGQIDTYLYIIFCMTAIYNISLSVFIFLFFHPSLLLFYVFRDILMKIYSWKFSIFPITAIRTIYKS